MGSSRSLAFTGIYYARRIIDKHLPGYTWYNKEIWIASNGPRGADPILFSSNITLGSDTKPLILN